MLDKAIVRDAVEMLKKHGVRPPYVFNAEPHWVSDDAIVGFEPNTGIQVTDDDGNLLPEWREG